jgi:drug/metabolite transporter (DMT)-like permease
VFLVVLLYALLASTFTLAKTALMYAKPFFLIGFRMTLAGILMLLYLFLFNRKKFVLKKEDLFLFLKVSLFHIYFAYIFDFWSLQYMTSSKSNLIYSATPFVAAVLSYFLLKERLGWKKFLGMLIGLSSLIPIFMTRDSGSFNNLFSISLPELALMFAVVSGAYAWFLVKELMVRGYSLLMINGFAMLVGGFLAFVTSFFWGDFSGNPIFDFWPFLVWTLVLIFVANFIVYNLYAWLFNHYSITFITSAGFLCPIFGTFYGWFFLDEKITWHYFVALILVAIGLYVFNKEEKRKKNGAIFPEGS